MGKKVIAVPRYHKYGEHVNDHQLQIVQTFDGQGFIKGINDFKPKKFESNTKNIIDIIENFIENN